MRKWPVSNRLTTTATQSAHGSNVRSPPPKVLLYRLKALRWSPSGERHSHSHFPSPYSQPSARHIHNDGHAYPRNTATGSRDTFTDSTSAVGLAQITANSGVTEQHHQMSDAGKAQSVRASQRNGAALSGVSAQGARATDESAGTSQTNQPAAGRAVPTGVFLGHENETLADSRVSDCKTSAANSNDSPVFPVADGLHADSGTILAANTTGAISKSVPERRRNEREENKTVISFRSGSLKPYDLVTLDEGEWINDNIIAFWFELIEAQILESRGHGSSGRASLWPPSVVELLCALPDGTSCPIHVQPVSYN